MKGKIDKITLSVILMSAIFLLAVVSFQCYRMHVKIAEKKSEIIALESQLKEEENRTEEIEQLAEYMQSDEYKKMIAKTKIGLIEDGEIIFKAR